MKISHAFWFILAVIYRRLFQKGSGMSPRQMFRSDSFVFIFFLSVIYHHFLQIISEWGFVTPPTPLFIYAIALPLSRPSNAGVEAHRPNVHEIISFFFFRVHDAITVFGARRQRAGQYAVDRRRSTPAQRRARREILAARR